MNYRVMMTAFLFLLMPGLVFAQLDGSIEFYGTIQSANSTAIVINGQIVDVQGAQVNTPLTIGAGVRVQASILPDGSLTAQQIDGQLPGIIPGIVEINGTVTSFVIPVLSVNGQAIDTTGAEFSGSVALGQMVRVFAVATAPGVWQAHFVDAAGDVPAPATTPEPDSGIIAPASTPEVFLPASTPEVFLPATTPEASGDSGNSGMGGDTSGGSGMGSG